MAQRRGMSPWIWAAITAFIVIGVLAVVFVRMEEEPRPNVERIRLQPEEYQGDRITVRDQLSETDHPQALFLGDNGEGDEPRGLELLVLLPENYEQEVATYTLSGEEKGVAEVTGDLIILDEDLDEYRDELGEDVLESDVFSRYDGQPALIADRIGRADPEQ